MDSIESGPLSELLAANRRWAERIRARDPDFFLRLLGQQSPKYLWIGCSDSRVPANTIVDLEPGEVFVHRNIANIINHADLNCLSVIQFAVDVLKVRHIIVCGHYGCSGVHAALEGRRIGLSDNWLNDVRDTAQRHHALLDSREDRAWKLARLCELNVIEQVGRACATTAVRDAWARDQPLTVHGWVYALHDGLVRDLGLSVSGSEQAGSLLGEAVARVARVG